MDIKKVWTCMHLACESIEIEIGKNKAIDPEVEILISPIEGIELQFLKGDSRNMLYLMINWEARSTPMKVIPSIKKAGTRYVRAQEHGWKIDPHKESDPGSYVFEAECPENESNLKSLLLKTLFHMK